MVAYWLIALPLGYYLGIMNADNAFDGAAGFWVGIIGGGCCGVGHDRRASSVVTSSADSDQLHARLRGMTVVSRRHHKPIDSLLHSVVDAQDAPFEILA